MSRLISYRLPDDLVGPLEARCAAQGCSASAVVTEALRRYLGGTQTATSPKAPVPHDPRTVAAVPVRSKTIVVPPKARVRGFDPITREPIYG